LEKQADGGRDRLVRGVPEVCVGGNSVVLFSARDDGGLCQIDGEIFVRMIWVV
jgi:hypothetical protein